MKLLTYENQGSVSLGIEVNNFVLNLKALSATYNEVTNSTVELPDDMLSLIQLGEAGEKYLHSLVEWAEANADATKAFSFSYEDVTVKAPISNPGKVVCVGNNYMDHCREQNVEPPKKPMIFSKWASCIIAPDEDIVLPEDSVQVDYEAELAVVIGKKGKNISEEEAMDYVYGYTVINDVSARDVQFEDVQWVRGKSYDTFAPLGPTIVTKDEIENPNNLDIKLELNGEALQDSNTEHLIFDIPYIISYLSKGFTFEPGDVIATGTPHGVGVFRDPQVFLKSGDVCRIEIEKVGVLENKVK
jgi:2-keto-4-pentenoate hydratase/2-oxohepta-3-ene-1,7-dioic acid hydratase in catechol pathway